MSEIVLRSRQGIRITILLVLLAFACLPLVAPAFGAKAAAAKVTSSENGDGVTALDWAYRFASAIKPDPKDMAKAQQSVIRAYVENGLLDRAIEQADAIEGWRRGVVFADLAAELGKQGRTEEAQSLLSEAKRVRSKAEGWRGPRVTAHIAQGEAAVGEYEKAEESAAKVAAGEQMYLGRALAIRAQGLAAGGKFDEAMKALEGVPDENKDINVRWWQTVGYLNLAKMGTLSLPERRKALDAAREAASKVPGWKRAESLRSIAREYLRFQKRRDARKAIEEAQEIVLAQPESVPVKAALISNVASSWAEYGDEERAQVLLSRAEKSVENGLTIEQPALWGNIASGYLSLGNEEAARRVIDKALSDAAGLTNARPRALAIVAILRTLGRAGFAPDDGMQARLEELLKGLKAPW